MSFTRSNRLRSSSVVVRARLELLLRQQLGELLEQVALLLGQLLRRLHLHGGEEVAACRVPLTSGMPLPLQPQRRARLRAFGDLHGLRAVERRHHDLAAERERREVDRDLAEQIHAVAPEELVLLDVDDDVEVAGRAARRCRLRLRSAAAAAGRWRCRPGILTVILRSLVTRPLPWHVVARLGDRLAGAAALAGTCARR